MMNDTKVKRKELFKQFDQCTMEQLEPLLPEALPYKKRTLPLDWGYQELMDEMLYRLNNRGHEV